MGNKFEVWCWVKQDGDYGEPRARRWRRCRMTDCPHWTLHAVVEGWWCEVVEAIAGQGAT